MILQLVLQILGITLFFLPGILLGYVISRKANIIKRMVYSIMLSPLIAIILGILLHFLGLLNQINAVLSLFFLSIAFLSIIFYSNVTIRTYFNKDLWYLLLFSSIGTLWRIYFLKSINMFSESYSYSYKFIGNEIPNLGFYTGMAIDHSRFIAMDIFFKISSFLYIDRFIDFFGIFLMVFLFLGLIYLIFLEYRDKRFAFVGVALMSLGPIEIFYTTVGFFGHSFSYLALFSLFLLYRSKDEDWFIVALLLSGVMIFTYFTSALINALASSGFVIALVIKRYFKDKRIKQTILDSLKSRKVIYFLIIAVVSSLFILGSYQFKEFKVRNMDMVTKHVTSYPLMKYQDPSLWGLSAIRWQMLFFLLCGVTFAGYLIKNLKKRFSENYLDLLVCVIPVLIVSFMFYYANFPTRIFGYFVFFGLLAIQIPRKYLRIFFVVSFVFILVTCWYVAIDKQVFFETSEGEIEGALWINSSLHGKIFSDQPFINQLVLNGYYNVTGAYDDDPLVYNLFYQNDSNILLNTTSSLRIGSNVQYIALAKRMREKYILMVNAPQKKLTNANIYEEHMEKVYDNGDVEVYQVP